MDQESWNEHCERVLADMRAREKRLGLERRRTYVRRMYGWDRSDAWCDAMIELLDIELDTIARLR